MFDFVAELYLDHGTSYWVVINAQKGIGHRFVSTAQLYTDQISMLMLNNDWLKIKNLLPLANAWTSLMTRKEEFSETKDLR